MSDLITPNGPGGALVPLDRPDGRTQWTFSHAGRSYAVFEVDGELCVTDGACPHNGGPLAEGLVRDTPALIGQNPASWGVMASMLGTPCCACGRDAGPPCGGGALGLRSC